MIHDGGGSMLCLCMCMWCLNPPGLMTRAGMDLGQGMAPLARDLSICVPGHSQLCYLHMLLMPAHSKSLQDPD